MRLPHIRALAIAIAFLFSFAFPFVYHAHAQDTDRSRMTDHPTYSSYVSYQTDAALAADSTQATNTFMLPFRKELETVAHKRHLPAALLAAICQEESGFRQWAARTEPSYLKNPRVKRDAKIWIRDHGGAPTYQTELHDRSTSMGLMQPMGQGCRERGFDSTFLSCLFEPINSIDQGATLLRTLIDRYGRDTLAAISAYNQGTARKSRGVFDNARYVFRVSVAWHNYSTILRHADNLERARGQMAMARRTRRRVIDSLQNVFADSTDQSSERAIDTNHYGALPIGHSSGSGHGSPAWHPVERASFQGGHGLADAKLYLIAACCLVVVLLGLLAFIDGLTSDSSRLRHRML